MENTEIHKIHSQLHHKKEKFPCPVLCWPLGIFCGSLLRHHRIAKVKEDKKKNNPPGITTKLHRGAVLRSALNFVLLLSSRWVLKKIHTS